MAGDLGANGVHTAIDLALSRLDGFVGDYSGLGSPALDRTKPYHFESEEYSPGEMRIKWREDPLVTCFIEKPPRAVFRRGFRLVTQSRDLDDAVAHAFVARNVTRALHRTLEFQRAFRGGGVLLKFDDAVDDPSRLSMPVRPGAQLLRAEAYDEQELMVIGDWWNHDILSHTFGQPLQWLWRPALGRGSQAYVHPSRLLIMSGPQPSNWDIYARAGWGVSQAHRALQHIADYYNSVRALLNTLQSSDLFVMGVKGLVAMRSRDDGRHLLQQLIFGWAQGRSNAGVLPIDADLESCQRMSASLSGLREAFDPLKETLAMAFDMPLAEIFSDEPSGLSTTGRTAQDRYDDVIGSMQKELVEPHIVMAAKYIIAEIAPQYAGGVTVAWAPLRQPTEVDKAKTRLDVAQADKIYFDMGMRLVDIVRSRYGGEEYSAETHVDPAWLEAQDRASMAVRRPLVVADKVPAK